jgi:gluconolactonase
VKSVPRLRAVMALLLLNSCCYGVNASAAPAERKFKLQALSPQFWKLVPRHSKLTRVATGFGFTEGPVWDAHGFLYLSDEVQNKIYKLFPNGRRETVVSLGDPDGNTYDLELQLIDCASVLRSIIRVAPDGRYSVLAGRYEGKRFNSPNDVVLGPDRAFYFTDPTLDLPKGQKQEIQFQGVYRLDSEGSLRLETKELTQPNGLAFSPDGEHFYVDDTAQRNIRVYDFHSGGELSKGRIFGDETAGPHEGVPDGMKVNMAGDLFVVGPLGIWVWNAQGQHLGTIVMPEQPANLAWGDKDYRTLYITATTSVYKLRTRTRGFVPYLAYVR